MRRLGALAVLLLLAAASGKAQAEAVFGETRLNGGAAMLVNFERDGDRLLARRQDLARLGLATPAAGPDLVDLGALKGVSYRFDPRRQTVDIAGPPDALLPTSLDARLAQDLVSPRSPWGGVVNYGYEGRAGSKGPAAASALVEARVFGPPGVLSTSLVGRTGAGGGAGSVQRLETAFVSDDPVRMRRLVVGDFVSSAMPWSRPAAVAGVSLSTDFSLRPDILVAPAPPVRGQTATPSAVDVYVDNVRRYSAKVPPGPFELRDLPTVDGRGTVSVVVTDQLGRQSVQSFPFYGSAALLRPGVRSLAVEAGFLREGYGGDDDRYTDGFVSAAVRQGLTKALTGEAQAVFARGVAVAGFGATAKLDEQALVSAAFSASASDSRVRPQAYVAFRRDTRPLSVFASATMGSAGFRDLAWLAGARPVRLALQAGASIDTGAGSFSLAYNRLRSGPTDAEIVALGWSWGAGPVDVHASVLASTRGARGTVVGVGLSMPLSGGRAVQATARSAPGGQTVSAGAGRAALRGWSWRAAAEAGGGTPAHVEAEARRAAGWGELGGGLSLRSGAAAARVYGSGSVVVLDRSLRFAEHVGDSFALVSTGVPGAEITQDNLPIGRTDRSGRLLASRLPPMAATRFAVRPESVGLSDDILVQEAVARPRRLAGVVLQMPVTPSRTIFAHVRFPDGGPAPAGARLLVDGAPRGVVGYEGLVRLQLSDLRSAVVVAAEDHDCVVETDDVQRRDPTDGAPILDCRPVRGPDRPAPGEPRWAVRAGAELHR